MFIFIYCIFIIWVVFIVHAYIYSWNSSENIPTVLRQDLDNYFIDNRSVTELYVIEKYWMVIYGGIHLPSTC
jgi:hypothetical protein